MSTAKPSAAAAVYLRNIARLENSLTWTPRENRASVIADINWQRVLLARCQ